MQVSTMQLTAQEQAMLRGEQGQAVSDALRYQMEVGEFFGATRFVPISNAHVMADIEVMGDGGLGHLRCLAEQQAACAVGTTTNARCTDFSQAEALGQSPGEIGKEREIVAMLQDMRMIRTDTCINYQTIYQPKLGEHVAWGDTGTVIYANSVLGARTNFEAGNASLAASLTGRTPAYGFHLDACRRGTIAVDVQAELQDIADWGALGKLVGHPNQDYFAVPVFQGIRSRPDSDDLKHLGCSLASYGSMAMFHMVGVTPEAPSAEAAFAACPPAKTMTITEQDLTSVYNSYRYIEGPENLVVFSGPQLSLFEIRRLAELFRGRKVAGHMHAFLTTNHGVLAEARRLGYVQPLEDAGVRILEGVCFYLLQRLSRIREENGWTNLVSNSAKLVNTITAHRFNTVLRRTRDCVDIACTGDLK